MRTCLSTATLILFSCTALAQAEQEPNDNTTQANALPAATSLSGSIGCDDVTADWFALTLPGDGRLDLAVNASNTNVPGSLQVQVFNSGGGLLANNVANSGGNTVLENPCYAAGLYYVQLYRNSSECYDYTITWSLAQPVYTSDTEPNNTLAQADALPALGAATDIDGHLDFLHYGDNTDHYRIVTLDQGSITFTAKAESDGEEDPVGLQLQLFNSGGGLLENWSLPVGGEGSTLTTAVTTYCKGAGTYYVQVYTNSPCGVSYRLRHEGTTPLYANDVEDNDNTGQATPVGYNTMTQGRVAFYYDDNEDWYAITPPDQGIINIELMAENVGASDATGLQVQLFNSGGGLLENWSVPVGGNVEPATGLVSTTCKGTGTYFVHVYANVPCGVSYQWRYSGTAPLYANDEEDNDNIAQAPAVEYDEPQEGRLDFYYGDNEDWYAITPPDQGIINIEVMAEHIGATDAAGLQVQLFNSGGGLLENWSVAVGGDTEPSTSVVSTTCKGTGTYFVHLYTNAPCGVSYRWRYSGTAPYFANDAEDNDNTAQADTISHGAVTDGRLSFYYDDNEDWYAIEPEDASIIHLNVQAEHVGGSDGTGLQVQFFNSGGGLLENWSVPVGGSSDPASTTLSTYCRGAGLYYVHFYTNAPCGVSYSWNYLTTEPVFGADPEPNNTIAEAPSISLENWWQDGRLAFYYGDNDDWYALSFSAGQNFLVSTSAEGPGEAGTMQVQLFNTGGGLLSNQTVDVGANGVSVDDVADFGIQLSGDYFLHLYANSICGMSYRLLCHDEDNDGICDGTAMAATAFPALAGAITAHPNPSADGRFRVSVPFDARWVELRDMNGRVIQYVGRPDGRAWYIDLSTHSAGVYSMRVGDPAGKVTSIRLVH